VGNNLEKGGVMSWGQRSRLQERTKGPREKATGGTGEKKGRRAFSDWGQEHDGHVAASSGRFPAKNRSGIAYRTERKRNTQLIWEGMYGGKKKIRKGGKVAWKQLTRETGTHHYSRGGVERGDVGAVKKGGGSGAGENS